MRTILCFPIQFSLLVPLTDFFFLIRVHNIQIILSGNLWIILIINQNQNDKISLELIQLFWGEQNCVMRSQHVTDSRY